MKVCCVSDTHGFLPDIPSCDLFIHCGDICPATDHHPGFQSYWLETNFKRWLKNIDAKKKVFIFGNHDMVGESHPSEIKKIFADFPGVYLQDSSTYFENLKIWGTPHTLYFFGWGFNLYEPDLAKKWDLIPNDTDIIVTHGPPFGYGDKAPRVNEAGFEHVGSPSLLERIKIIKPKLVCFGHIHPGRGQWELLHEDGKKTIIANVTVLNDRYDLVHKPMVFELEDKNGNT